MDSPLGRNRVATDRRRPPALSALYATLIYLAFAWLWIILSDRALASFSPDLRAHVTAQTIKGLIFITATGALFYAVIYARAIQQRRDEATLRESEAMFRSAFESVAVGMVITQVPDGRITRVNRKMCQITGYSEDELLAKRLREITHPDDDPHAADVYQALVRGTAEAIQIETRYLRKDGTTVWAQASAAEVIIDNPAPGTPRRMVVMVQDITESKLAQEQLRASEARFRELTDTMPQMVYTCGPDGHADYFNRQWSEYIGMTVEEANDDGWQRFIHPDDFPKLYARWADATERGVAYEAEYRVRPVNKPDAAYRWQLARAVPARDAQGKIAKWFGTVTDIDDQKRAIAQVRELNETLEQRVRERTAELQNANEGLAAFGYTVSRDLRAPLKNLQNMTIALIDKHGKDVGEDGNEALLRIVAAAARMDRLITDLLDYSRLSREQLQLSPVSTVTIVHELLGQLQRDPATSGAVVQVQEPLPWVVGNRLMLQQAFAHLIDNAIKFAHPGQQPHVNIWASESDGLARIWVEDQGIGIAEADFNRIFTPFETLQETNSAPPGAGIGLAIVKRAVERMGGRIGLQSTSGAGASFWIELPVAKMP